MPGFRWFVAASAFALLSGSLFAADRQETKSPLIDAVLRQEKTSALDRRAALQAEVDARQAEALWQAGFVLQDGQWMPFEKAGQDGTRREQQDEYLERRGKLENTARSHLELANWCRRVKLPDLERAHLQAALVLSPDADNRDLLVRLGFREVGGQWLSPEEIEDWQAQLAFGQASLKTWGPRLTLAAEQLSSKGRKYQAGVSTLDQLRDRGCVPAVEWVLAGQAEPIALMAIDVLNRIEGPEATVALARQAVFNKWPGVRHRASEALIRRKPEDYAPPLLSLLATATEATRHLRFDARQGTLIQSYLLARETADQFQVQSLEISRQHFKVVEFFGRPDPNAVVNPFPGIDAPRAIERGLTDADRAARDDAFRLQKHVEQANARVQELNDRVMAVLGRAAGESRSSVREWWSWWDGYNDYGPRPKRIRRSGETIAERSPTAVMEMQMRSSCLVAGTPVWTDRGPRPVEKLQVGDRLLTQSLEDGALGYAPVIHTTARDQAPVFRLNVGGESLTANASHRFWVPGQGWVRVSDLEPGMLLHTATGTVPLSSRETAGDAPVYNVVLSPTHNYFVGGSALLTHDVTVPRPTNRRVPGLEE